MNNTRTVIPLQYTQSEFELVTAEEILAAIPNAVFGTDKDMRIIYFNKIAEAITGFRKEEAIGMYCRDVIKSDLCESHCLIKQALDSGENIFYVDTEITTSEGEKVPVLVNASVLRNRLGEIAGYLVIFQDISDIKKTLKELQQAKKMLAEKNRSLRLAYKELELTQKQLLHAQKMESLGRLAGGISHHFNNLLCGILGYTRLLKDQLGQDNIAQKYLNMLEKSALKAAELTQKMLAFAQGEKYELKLVNVNEIINKLVAGLKQTLGDEIRIELELSPDIPLIKVDANQIYHALFNLCMNAIEAIPEGGIILIKTASQEILHHTELSSIPPGHYLVISVSDTGIGIKPEFQDKIFEPFFTTKEPGKGTGLGLAVVYGIIKAHHGYITLESSPGKGTTFYIYLPV